MTRLGNTTFQFRNDLCGEFTTIVTLENGMGLQKAGRYLGIDEQLPPQVLRSGVAETRTWLDDLDKP